MASRVAGKIKLQSVDELLGVPEIAGTQEIEIGRIHAFPNHPFKVLDDEKMDTLVDSIRKNGIYIHKNTLQYKLNNIHTKTGLDPRRFQDAVILYLATRLKNEMLFPK